MRRDRLHLRACAASFAMLAFTASATADAPVIGKPAVLSYLRLGGDDSCGLRDGDALLTATHGRLYWLDGATGAIRRSVPLPRAWPPCAMTMIDDARTHAYAIASPALDETDFVVVSPNGSIKARTSIRGRAADIIGLVAVDGSVFLAFQPTRENFGTVYVLSARTLAVERSHRVGPIAALSRRGDEAIAVLESGDAFALRDAPAATPFEFPRISYEHCGEPRARRKSPVPLGNGTYVSFECVRGRGGVLRVRQANGTIVAERKIPSSAAAGHAWFFTEESTVVPWDDGVRILANAEDSDILSILRVPVAAGPQAVGVPVVR